MNKTIDTTFDKYSCLRNVQKMHNKITILDYDEAIDYLIKEKISLARIGDGEFKLMQGGSLKFQKYDKLLAERLNNIMTSEISGLAVGINRIYFDFTVENLTNYMQSFVQSYVNRHYENWVKFLTESDRKLFLPSEFTFLYQILEHYKFENYFKKNSKVMEKS